MPVLSVSGSCTSCGLCASACPWRIITLRQGESPRFEDTGAQRCNLCGHCEAVCPSGAMAIEDPRLAGGSSASGAWQIEPQRLGDYLRMRRSVRRFREEPADTATIAEAIDIARFAPSGRNRQDVAWLITHDTAEVRRLTQLAFDWMRQGGAAGTALAARFDVPAMLEAWECGRDPLCLRAPHLVIACAPRDNPVGRTNALVALAHLDVAAPALGLGTCWGGILMLALDSCPTLKSGLGIPPDHDAVHCLMLGYPAINYQRPPRRNRPNIVWR